MQTADADIWLSVNDVAKRLGVSTQQVRNLIKSGLLKASRPSISPRGWLKVRLSDLEDYQARCQVTAA